MEERLAVLISSRSYLRWVGRCDLFITRARCGWMKSGSYSWMGSRGAAWTVILAA
jgi:hypothetical protein